MLDGSQHGGAELGSHAVPRRGLGPRSMMAFRGPLGLLSIGPVVGNRGWPETWSGLFSIEIAWE